ncbi:hypothetical protein Gotri_024005, partial [Gossypium trilobum]|nr:hypothetical protein [Gossypium trilobum]
CFTFRGVDLVPTVEEYMALLCCSKIQVDKAYSRAVNIVVIPRRDDISEEKWMEIL